MKQLKRSIEFDISGTTNLISRVLTLMPTDYVYYFPFNDTTGFNNLGSYKSSVPNASIDGGIGPIINTIGGKRCLTIPNNNQCVYFPAFGITPDVNPTSQWSFGFWCYMVDNRETCSINDLTFNRVNIFNGDVFTNFSTFISSGGTTNNVVFSNYYSTFSTWVHILYTFNSTNGYFLYVNGTKESPTSNSFGLLRSAEATNLTNFYMILGRAGDSSTRYFNGCGMREFLFYNRTLSDTEVASIYNSTS